METRQIKAHIFAESLEVAIHFDNRLTKAGAMCSTVLKVGKPTVYFDYDISDAHHVARALQECEAGK